MKFDHTGKIKSCLLHNLHSWQSSQSHDEGEGSGEIFPKCKISPCSPPLHRFFALSWPVPPLPKFNMVPRQTFHQNKYEDHQLCRLHVSFMYLKFLLCHLWWDCMSQAFCSLILLRFFCFCFFWCFHCSSLCFISWYFSVTFCYFYSVGMNGKNTSLKWKWLMLKRSSKETKVMDTEKVLNLKETWAVLVEEKNI